jgi:hypothetical protein
MLETGLERSPVKRSTAKTKTPSNTAASLSPTIFHEPWWMEISSSGRWAEAVVSSGGHIVGRLPYQISKRVFGMKALDMPSLVHVLGPAVDPQFTSKNFPRSLKELSIIRELIAQLPRASHITFRLHNNMTHTLAFDVAGFTSKPSYTVEIKPDTREALWRQMRDKTRNIIRRAQECLHVETVTDPEVFLDFYGENLQNMGRKNIYKRDTCSQLLAECLHRRVGRILVAKNQQGAIQSAVFTVWDKAREYYFMSSRRPDAVNGATALLIWEALQHASEHQLSFDLDGIHIVDHSLPNLVLLSSFGGVVTTRYLVQRSSPLVQLAYSLREYWYRAWPHLSGGDQRDSA